MLNRKRQTNNTKTKMLLLHLYVCIKVIILGTFDFLY